MKRILLVLICLFCFGCEAKYELTINEDLSVVEEITGLEKQEFYDNYFNSSKERVIGFMLDIRREYLDEIGYSDQLITENELNGAMVSKTFSNLDEYFEKSEAYTQFYENFDHALNDGVLTINLEDQLLRNENDQERFLIDNCEVAITTPFKIKKSNADHIDRDSNTYIWKLDSENAKDIHIEIDTKKIVNLEWRKYINYIIVFFCVSVVCTIIYIFYRKNKENNKID